MNGTNSDTMIGEDRMTACKLCDMSNFNNSRSGDGTSGIRHGVLYNLEPDEGVAAKHAGIAFQSDPTAIMFKDFVEFPQGQRVRSGEKTFDYGAWRHRDRDPPAHLK